jgi:uncharacterized protein (DUF1810 family)
MNDITENDLERFLEAQEYGYPASLRELRAGRKQSHWLWYIFPQLRGLGSSSRSHFYGIKGIAEALAYLAHPILSERLIKLSEILLLADESDPVRIFGEIDAHKLQSSMTLFLFADPDNAIFAGVLRKYYEGKQDPVTLGMLRSEEASHK